MSKPNSKKRGASGDFIRTNEQIRAQELRVVGAEGENHGVISLEKALDLAQEAGLDLIEISPNAVPPVAKIMDYGKYKYEQSKKDRERRANQSSTETRVVQIKVGTGEHDLELKAKRVSKWLAEGDRVKLELYLRGRSKYMSKEFLEERISRVLKLLTTDYKVAESLKKGPKGMYMIVEKAK